MMPCPRCQDSGRPGYVRHAWHRYTWTECGCDNGFITEARASMDDVDLELMQLHALKRDYEKRIAELEAKVELRESCLRAYSVRIHELFGVSIVSPESWDNIPHCLAIVKLRMDEQKAENVRERAASVLVEAERDRLRAECERLGNAAADARWSVQP